MISIVSEPYKYFTNKTTWNTVRNISGLSAALDIYKEKDGSISVDVDIIDVIIKLNEMGLTTLFCCSGILENHSHKEPPYVAFDKLLSDDKRCRLDRIFTDTNFTLDKKDGIFVFSYRLSSRYSNKKIKESWDLLREKIDL